MSFQVGQKVVCVGDFSLVKHIRTEILPVKDEIYTVREVTNFGMICIRLIEIVNAPKMYNEKFDEVTFDVKEFRAVDTAFGKEVCEEISKELIKEAQPCVVGE